MHEAEMSSVFLKVCKGYDGTGSSRECLRSLWPAGRSCGVVSRGHVE